MTSDAAGRAQAMFWEIRQYEADGVPAEAIRPLHSELARLYESVALRDLDGAGVGSWPDLLAAITHFGSAGESEHAVRLLAEGRLHHPPRAPAMHAELDRLETWMANLPVADEYRRSFAELAVQRALGTLTPGEEANRESQLANLLHRLPSDLREAIERWCEAQAQPHPVSAPESLKMVEVSDPSTRPFEVAA